MDIDQEIAIHLEWIESLVSLIGTAVIPEEAIDDVRRHDRCELGRWLTSEGAAAFRDVPDFGQLGTNHEAFHRLAGELLRALQAGDEARVLELQEHFLSTSRQVMSGLSALKAHSV